MKNLITLFFLVSVFQGCQYFKKNVPVKDDLVQQELKKINWNEVDDFPSTAQCDSVNDRTARKQCFFNFVTNNIQEKFKDSVKILFPKIDTIPIKITILTNTKIQFELSLTKYSMVYDIPKLDSILQTKLLNFPAIEPAIKRGIKVKSQFILPVILK